jgi:hypothetical protein
MKPWDYAVFALLLLGPALVAEEAKPEAPTPQKAEAPAASPAEPAANPTAPTANPTAPTASATAPSAGPAAPAPGVVRSPEGPAPKEQDTTKAGNGATGWDRYQILIKRNVFSKSRGREREEARIAAQKPPPPKPEAETVLIGVAEKDGQLVAFLENTKTGAVQKVRKDDPVARGKVVAITLNSIEYECEGKTLVVGTGSNLEGGAPVKGGEPGKTAASAAAPGSGDAGSVLERLRRKRLEEMNR